VHTALLVLILVALIPHLFLAGGGLARMAVQLPARRRLGPVAFAQYSRYADLGRGGLTLYPLLGVGGPLATWAALAVAYASGTAATVKVFLLIAAGLCVLHIFTTARAAPTMLLIGRSADDPHVLGPLIEKFVRRSRPRLTLQVLAAGVLIGALIALRGAGELSPAVFTVALAALCLVTVLSGATLEQLVVQLPASRRIGTAAYADFLRATDLKNGRLLYPLIGLSSNAALVGALVLAVVQPAPARYCVALAVAAGCGACAFLVVRRVLPAAGQLLAGPGGADEAAVGRIIWGVRARAPFFLLAFASLLWVLTSR
jgi:hypothetical protein